MWRWWFVSVFLFMHTNVSAAMAGRRDHRDVKTRIKREVIQNTFYEGDIATDNQDKSSQGSSIRNAWLTAKGRLWPQGVIYYQIDTSSIRNVDVHHNISLALKHISDCSCLVFNQIPSTQSATGDFIHFRAHGDDNHDGSGCWSYLGRKGGAQVINIPAPQCTSVQMITHEVLHATGALHEHNRPDRDQYIQILYDNIKPDMIKNFAKHDWEYDNATYGVDNFGTAYDFYSILHYPYNAHGINSSVPTMISLMTNDTIFGSTGTMTTTDEVELNLNYGCPISSHLLVRYLHDTVDRKCMSNAYFETVSVQNDKINYNLDTIEKITKEQEKSRTLIESVKEKQELYETLTDYSIGSLIGNIQSLKENVQINEIRKATFLTLINDFKNLKERVDQQEKDIQNRDNRINELEFKLNGTKVKNLDNFGPLTIQNMDSNRTHITFVTKGQLEKIQECRFSFTILTDMRFRMQRDDSESHSNIRYWRPDTNEIEEFSFMGGYADHTRVEYDGQTLICIGPSNKKNYQCQKLIEGESTKAVVLSVDFNPRFGKAHNNQWNRNKYSFTGSFYTVKCLGYVTLTRVHFSVQHHGHYDIASGSTITYDGSVINIGNAMDLNTGVFTAGTPGTYEFTFAGLKNPCCHLRVYVFVNGVKYVQIFAQKGAYEHVSRTFVLQLVTGSTVHLVLAEGSLYGDVAGDPNFTEFTGKLII